MTLVYVFPLGKVCRVLWQWPTHVLVSDGTESVPSKGPDIGIKITSVRPAMKFFGLSELRQPTEEEVAQYTVENTQTEPLSPLFS